MKSFLVSESPVERNIIYNYFIQISKDKIKQGIEIVK